MKKTLKSILALTLALVAVLAFASCGSKKQLTVSKLEESLKTVDSSLSLTESSSGVYTASTSYEYTVETNGSKGVKSVKITMSGVDVYTLKSESSLNKSLSKSAGQMSRVDLAISNCVLMAGALRTAVGGSSATKEESISLFASQTAWTVDSWTIQAEYSGSSTVILTATAK
ncbi:MAG: hypothetical protein IJR88_03460 [Clostridia bacterium]|nr:hypothetical protein [Clostridia bacterium]